MDKYEKLMDRAGRWGPYQKMISLIVILTSFSMPMILLTLPMMQKEPNFKYDNGTEMVEVLDKEQFCSEVYYTEPFSKMYDRIIIEEGSIYNWAYQLKIVCNTRQILAMAGTVFFLASIAGNLTFSKFPDRYGRRRVFVFLNIISFISLIQLFFLHHISQLIFASFLMGLGSLNLAVGSVIINEVIDEKYSGLIMGITNSMFPLGGVINTIFIYFFSDWRYFIVTNIIVYLAANVSGFYYLKETPKWLYANQHYVEFRETIEFIARVNGNALDGSNFDVGYNRRKSSITIAGKDEEYRKHIYEVTDLLKYESVRGLTLKNLYLWIFSGFSFFGLLLNLEGLTGNIFVDAIVTYTAEFIAEVGSGAISHQIGRRKTILISLILASGGTFLFIFIKILPIEIISLFTAAIGVASAFNVLYIYANELFPTNIKSLSISVFSLVNRLAGGTIPIILTFTRNITLAICILSFVALFVVLSMPESLGYHPGDEVEEVKEEMYENDEDDDKNFLYFHDLFEESF